MRVLPMADHVDTNDPLPLAGLTVVDCSRMLPGAVLGRMLLDLGARLIKVEDPRTGDMMRSTPPLVGGTGVGFCVFFRGAESVALNLRDPEGAAALRALAARADLLIESFRPGTLTRWGLALPDLRAANQRLITCSLPGFVHSDPARAGAIGHDMNFVGLAGLSSLLHSQQIPGVQFADITAGTLACTALLAALLRRATTGRGGHVTQPLMSGPMQFMTWPWAERASNNPPFVTDLLGGTRPCYRAYTCQDGKKLMVGCLEPKFWFGLTAAMQCPELAAAGLDAGEPGQRAIAQLEAKFASHPRQHWLDVLAPTGLPVTPIHDLADALHEPQLVGSGLLEQTPMPDGSTISGVGPTLPSVSRTPDRPAPALGAHTRDVLAEFGVAGNNPPT